MSGFIVNKLYTLILTDCFREKFDIFCNCFLADNFGDACGIQECSKFLFKALFAYVGIIMMIMCDGAPD